MAGQSQVGLGQRGPHGGLTLVYVAVQMFLFELRHAKEKSR